MGVRQHGEMPNRDDHGDGSKVRVGRGRWSLRAWDIYVHNAVAPVVFPPFFSMSATPQVIVQQTPQQPSMLSKSTL